MLPLQRTELISLRARRAAGSAAGRGSMPARRLTAATYWEAVLADLQRLLAHRWAGTLPSGQRDSWLFVACVAMSWIAPPFVLRREFRALAQEVGGWPAGEADSRMGAVFRRAEAAVAGRTVEWNGRAVDPRYRLRAATIVEALRVTPAEMCAAGLRVLVDRDVARKHAAERQRTHRQRAGVQERSAYESAAAARATAAAALRAAGMSWAQVAAHLELPSPDAARVLASRAAAP
ncbi:hypothetical protein ACFQU2_28375 [Siccirubricoccus deserti]